MYTSYNPIVIQSFQDIVILLPILNSLINSIAIDIRFLRMGEGERKYWEVFWNKILVFFPYVGTIQRLNKWVTQIYTTVKHQIGIKLLKVLQWTQVMQARPTSIVI
jgi:hypothetical protein